MFKRGKFKERSPKPNLAQASVRRTGFLATRACQITKIFKTRLGPSTFVSELTTMASLWIINKAGGLVYQADHFAGTQRLTSNEALILAGTLHGIHAITARIDPTPGPKRRGEVAGLQTLEADHFRLSVLLTATGGCFSRPPSRPSFTLQ